MSADILTQEEAQAEIDGFSAKYGRGDGVANLMLSDGSMWTVYDGHAMKMWDGPREAQLKRAPWDGEIKAAKRRGKVTETVFEDDCALSWLPDGLTKAVAWLQEKLDAVPPEYRKSARISMSSRFSYGESYPTVEITYQRPETNEEWAARKIDVQERVEYATAQKRVQLERLKAELEAS